jgi:restriction endonuclease S subunit
MIASANVLEENKTDIVVVRTEEKPNKGIRNVGDLINFVVDKVDKREKKVIQFATDEDNSSIVALNIGFIKFNKKSDK